MIAEKKKEEAKKTHPHHSSGASGVNKIAALGSALGLDGLQNLEMVVTNSAGETSVVKGGLFDLINLSSAVYTHHPHTSGGSGASGASGANRIASLGSALGINGLQNLALLVNHNGELSTVPGTLF